MDNEIEYMWFSFDDETSKVTLAYRVTGVVQALELVARGQTLAGKCSIVEATGPAPTRPAAPTHTHAPKEAPEARVAPAKGVAEEVRSPMLLPTVVHRSALVPKVVAEPEKSVAVAAAVAPADTSVDDALQRRLLDMEAAAAVIREEAAAKKLAAQQRMATARAAKKPKDVSDGEMLPFAPAAPPAAPRAVPRTETLATEAGPVTMTYGADHVIAMTANGLTAVKRATADEALRVLLEKLSVDVGLPPEPIREVAVAVKATEELPFALVGAPSFRQVMSWMLENGYTTQAAISERCEEIRTQVPAIDRLSGDLRERVGRALEVMALSTK